MERGDDEEKGCIECDDCSLKAKHTAERELKRKLLVKVMQQRNSSHTLTSSSELVVHQCAFRVTRYVKPDICPLLFSGNEKSMYSPGESSQAACVKK